MEKNREELQRLYFEAESHRRNLESISSQIQMLEAAINETDSAIKAVDSLEEAKEGDEMLVPVGSGSFIRASIKDRENVIIGIGAEISVEKKAAEAKGILEKRKSDMNDAMEKLRNNAREANEKLMELNSRSESIVRELQAGKQE